MKHFLDWNNSQYYSTFLLHLLVLWIVIISLPCDTRQKLGRIKSCFWEVSFRFNRVTCCLAFYGVIDSILHEKADFPGWLSVFKYCWPFIQIGDHLNYRLSSVSLECPIFFSALFPDQDSNSVTALITFGARFFHRNQNLMVSLSTLGFGTVAFSSLIFIASFWTGVPRKVHEGS